MPETGCLSVRIQNAQAQKFDTGAPVHLTFQKLETIDMTFGLAVAR